MIFIPEMSRHGFQVATSSYSWQIQLVSLTQYIHSLPYIHNIYAFFKEKSINQILNITLNNSFSVKLVPVLVYKNIIFFLDIRDVWVPYLKGKCDSSRLGNYLRPSFQSTTIGSFSRLIYFQKNCNIVK